MSVDELVAQALTLPEAGWRGAMASLATEQQAEVMKRLSQATLVQIGRRSVDALKTYSAQLVKRERVGGELLPAQRCEIHVREKPYAVLMDFVEGPGKGRRVLYNETIKKHEVRAKESGFLGIVGAVWVGIDSGFTRKESTHRITDTGLGPTLKIIEKDVKQAEPLGGHTRVDEGLAKDGLYCLMATAPNGGKGFYAAATRICSDMLTGLPLRVESFDAKGMFESFTFSKVKPTPLPDSFFSLKGTGL